MYNKMLVLLDGSKTAENVFSYAQGLSARLHINLELLQVCPPQEAEYLPMRQAYMDHMAEALSGKVAEICSKTPDKTQGEAPKAVGKVIVGYPAEEILKYADKSKTDLIMLSTHGHSGVKRWDLGGVANKVVRASKVPVWLIPSELREEIIHDEMPNRSMVIPLDGSKLAEGVIPHALTIAKQRGAEAEIVLVKAVEIYIGYTSLTELKHSEDEKLKAKRYLDNVGKRIAKEGLKVRTEVLVGPPPEAIIDFVKNNPANLIAMATHGHAALSRMIFGTVTEHVLRLVKKTPIFLVKPRMAKRKK